MINQFRTLLLNVSGNTSNTLPGEEYIPPTFHPVTAPPVITKMRRQIFGEAPDRFKYNYRARQITNLLHSTELAEFIYDLDPRVTYWPNPATDIYRFQFGVTAKAFGGTTAMPTFLGNLPAETSNGQLVQSWRVVVAGASVVITQLQPYAAQSEASLVFTSGLSSPISLVQSPDPAALSFTLPETVSSGNGWTVTAVTQPADDLGAVAATLTQIFSQEDQVDLFGISPVEPYLTFSNLWNTHKQLPYKLGGLDHIEELAYNRVPLSKGIFICKGRFDAVRPGAAALEDV